MKSVLDLLIRGRRVSRQTGRTQDDAVVIKRELLVRLLDALDKAAQYDTSRMNEVTILPLLSEAERIKIAERGTGRTTKLMIDAPHGAFFIFRGAGAHYLELMRKHGRQDLRLRSMSAASIKPWRGTRIPVVLDHYVTEPMTETVTDLIRDVNQHNERIALDAELPSR